MLNEYTFVFDIDGTICPIKKTNENYSDLIPYDDIVKKIKYFKLQGAKVILYTSRNMNSFKNNIGKINKFTGPELMNWLSKWDIPFDEIHFGKPWAGNKGFYIDDRAIRPNELLENDLASIENILLKSALGNTYE